MIRAVLFSILLSASSAFALDCAAISARPVVGHLKITAKMKSPEHFQVPEVADVEGVIQTLIERVENDWEDLIPHLDKREKVARLRGRNSGSRLPILHNSVHRRFSEIKSDLEQIPRKMRNDRFMEMRFPGYVPSWERAVLSELLEPVHAHYRGMAQEIEVGLATPGWVAMGLAFEDILSMHFKIPVAQIEGRIGFPKRDFQFESEQILRQEIDVFAIDNQGRWQFKEVKASLTPMRKESNKEFVRQVQRLKAIHSALRDGLVVDGRAVHIPVRDPVYSVLGGVGADLALYLRQLGFNLHAEVVPDVP